MFNNLLKLVKKLKQKLTRKFFLNGIRLAAILLVIGTAIVPTSVFAGERYDIETVVFGKKINSNVFKFTKDGKAFTVIDSTGAVCVVDHTASPAQLCGQTGNRAVAPYLKAEMTLEAPAKLVAEGDSPDVVFSPGTIYNGRDRELNGFYFTAVNKKLLRSACIASIADYNTCAAGPGVKDDVYPLKPGTSTQITSDSDLGITLNKGAALVFDVPLDYAFLQKVSASAVTGAASNHEVLLLPSIATGALDPVFVLTPQSFSVQVYDTVAELKNDKDSRPAGYENNNSTTTQGSGSGSSVTGTLLTFVASFLATILQLLTTLIYWLFAFIIAPLIEAMLSIHPYQDVFVQVIYPGWLILRNLSNILFIIVLLVIGLATLFQVEKYNYKHLLVKVVIAAIMVNFSLVIGQAVLGIADTVQNQFLPERLNVIRALGFELMVKPIQKMQLDSSSASAGLSNLTYPFFLFALALGAFFAFVAILLFLVVRIVGLWVLLMVSPVAYVARILPETEKYAEEWWKKFLTYAFITPIFAFFLNIAALFATSHVFGQGSPIFSTSTVTGGIAEFVYLTASHVTVLVFLFAGLSFAGSSGVVGAKAITDFAKKGIKLPFKAAGGAALGGAGLAAGYAMRKKTEKSIPLEKKGFLGKLAFSALNPGAVKEAWKKRGEELRGDVSSVAQGAATNVIKGLPLINEDTIDETTEAFHHGVQKKKEEVPVLGERQGSGMIKNITKAGDQSLSGRQRFWAAFENMAANKSMNHMLNNAKELLGADDNYAASDVGFVQLMNDLQRKGWGNKAEVGHEMAALTAIGYTNREYWYSEKYATHNGHAAMIRTDKDGKKIAGEKEYLDVEAHFNSKQFADEVEKTVQAQIQGAGGSVTKDVEKRFRRNARAKAKDDYEKGLEKTKQHKYEEYDNYKTFADARKEAFINQQKQAPQQKARDMHWSNPVDVYPNGEIKFSAYGLSHILHADQGDYGQGGQLNPKKREAMMQAILEDEANTLDEIRKLLKAQLLEEKQNSGEVITQQTINEINYQVDGDGGANQGEAKQKVQAYKQFYIYADKYDSKTNNENMVTYKEGAPDLSKSKASRSTTSSSSSSPPPDSNVSP